MSRSRRTTTARLTLAFAFSLTAVACSGGSTESTPSSPPTSLPLPVDTASPPVTDASTTTTSTTTTSTTTTVAPSTTIDETAALIAEIQADLVAGEQAYLQGGMAPGSPEAQALAAQFNAGPALERTLERYAGFAADGLLLRPNPEVPNVIVVDALIDRVDSTATVDICRIDAYVTYQPIGDGGTEVIFDDRVGRFLTTTQLVFQDGTWKIYDGTTNDLTIGVDSCDG
jgi:hypothetical protein